MAILNYTTEIDAHRTVGEIQRLLVAHGAKSIMVDYEVNQPVALAFQIEFNGQRLPFRLPCRHKRVLTLLQERRDSHMRPKQRTEQHALNVAWRIVKDWTEAQVALVEVGMADITEVFFPYALISTGDTFYEQYKKSAGLIEAK